VVQHSTTDDERGEIPRCLACGKVAGESALVERDPDEGALTFCDASCREVYFTRMDQALEDDREAA